MTTRFILLGTVTATLAASSTAPIPSASLDRARSSFNRAQTDAQVAQLAPDELGRAHESLRIAEKAHTDGAGAERALARSEKVASEPCSAADRTGHRAVIFG